MKQKLLKWVLLDTVFLTPLGKILPYDCNQKKNTTETSQPAH